MFAAEHGRPVPEVLAACEKEWERNWKFQHPDLRADSDAPGGAGNQNRVSLENVYSSLGIPSPLQEGTKIPPEAIAVRTANSAYRFGAADEQGKRKVERENNPLPFKACKIIFLAVGKEMVLDHGGTVMKGWFWYTTPVQSIT